jgi:hypothetical protein
MQETLSGVDADCLERFCRTREFKKTYGLTPGHWAEAVAAPAFPGRSPGLALGAA